MIREKIEALHGANMLRKSALNIRNGAGAIEWAMAGKGFHVALEIGTYRGVSAAEMAQYCDRVITIDLKNGRLESAQEKHDRHAFWKSLGIDNIDLRLVQDDEEKTKLIRSLEFDFAFVDGAHDAGVNLDFSLVKKCGNVLFHDYEPNFKPGRGHVFDLVSSLPANEVEIKDIFALWTSRAADPETPQAAQTIKSRGKNRRVSKKGA